MKRAMPFQEPQLFASMNVTPFIDVMLVLLVMLIITIPIQSHVVKIDLPSNPVSTTKPALPHKLTIDAAGTVYWDGSQVKDSALPKLLETTLYEDADLQVQTDPATRYERFDQVLAIVKQSGITRLGFVGNERMTL